jgi:hypothetical protein
MHHLDGVVATATDQLAPIDGQDGNVHAVAVAVLARLLARLELSQSRVGQQGILRSVRRQIPSWYCFICSNTLFIFLSKETRLTGQPRPCE